MARRKTDIEPIIRPEYPDVDPILRDEVDPDPLVEEMVGRLRAGLSSMVAIDEWGRPVAWRNVVRLALGPLAGKLRDTEQALNLAVSLIPDSEPLSSVEHAPVEQTAPPALAVVPEPIAEAVIDASAPPGSRSLRASATTPPALSGRPCRAISRLPRRHVPPLKSVAVVCAQVSHGIS